RPRQHVSSRHHPPIREPARHSLGRRPAHRRLGSPASGPSSHHALLSLHLATERTTMPDTFRERRMKLRALLEASSISHPGSVWNVPSARLAQAAGFELGIFAGSVGSAVVLGAPDLV